MTPQPTNKKFNSSLAAAKLMSPPDNHWKQFDILIVYLKEFSEKVHFEKISKKSMNNNQACKELKS